MKMLASVFLAIFFTLCFPILVITSSFKFQILNSEFWIKTFYSHDTYQKISVLVKDSMDKQIVVGGGNRNDVKVFTDLITPENTEDFVNKNIVKITNFLNGQESELKVYIPLSKVPKDLLPKSVLGMGEEVPASLLAEKLNVQGFDDMQISELSRVGFGVTVTIFTVVLILVSILVILFVLTNNGTRLVSIGLTMVINGLIVLMLADSGKNLQKLLVEYALVKTKIWQILIGTVMPPVVGDVVMVWSVVGISMILLGIVICFVKKPVFNKKPFVKKMKDMDK